MKRKFLLTFLCFSIALTGIAQNSANSKEEKDQIARTLQPPDGKALVYILRPSIFGLAVRMFLDCDSVHIGSTMAHNFVYALLEPGTHTLMSTSENHPTLEITVEAGKVYYIKQEVKMGTVIAKNRAETGG
jgi:hypothetical protein